jgi:hypothetical protein
MPFVTPRLSGRDPEQAVIIMHPIITKKSRFIWHLFG